MFFSLYVISSVSRSNRRPLQTSQGTYTVGKKCISIAITPWPSHCSHRPPGRLKLKRPFLYPRYRASDVDANISRIGSHAPVYVAGLERDVRPIAHGSIKI